MIISSFHTRPDWNRASPPKMPSLKGANTSTFIHILEIDPKPSSNIPRIALSMPIKSFTAMNTSYHLSPQCGILLCVSPPPFSKGSCILSVDTIQSQSPIKLRRCDRSAPDGLFCYQCAPPKRNFSLAFLE